MKTILSFTLLLMTSSTVFAQGSASEHASVPVMNLFELGIKPGKTSLYNEFARNNIRASVKGESGTMAMYSVKRKDNPDHAYMVEIYSDDNAYKMHLDSTSYKAFLQRSPEFVSQKRKIEVVPQFLSDKKIVQNANTINNLVIVDVKPEYQKAFKDIVFPEMAASMRIEDGVLAMYAATDAKNEYRWYFYEIYASEADYQKHRETPHFRDYIDKTADMTTWKESVPVAPDFLGNKGGVQFIFGKSR